MHTHDLLRACALLTAALAACTTGAPSPSSGSATPSAAATTPVAPEPHDEQRFLATFEAPCGRSLLAIRETPDGKPIAVQAKGNSPHRVLRYDMLIHGRWVVYGKLHRHALVDDGHCGAYPTFEVTRFEPWGPIRRCTSIGSLDLERYTEHLPTDRYVPEDFRRTDAPSVYLDTSKCQANPSGAPCPADRVAQHGCTMDKPLYCCPKYAAP